MSGSPARQNALAQLGHGFLMLRVRFDSLLDGIPVCLLAEQIALDLLKVSEIVGDGQMNV